jgi:hypothetical protein
MRDVFATQTEADSVHRKRDFVDESACKRAVVVARVDMKLTPSFASEGVIASFTDPSRPLMIQVNRWGSPAYFVRTGDQANQPSSVGLRVRFRCSLPSVFMT